jgi:hypothetical protein
LLACIRFRAHDAFTVRVVAIAASLLALAASLVRPDGILYVIAFPCAALYAAIPDRAARHGVIRSGLPIYCSTFAVAFGGFLLFRWWYFEDVLPNTYYAKGGPQLESLLDLILLRTAALGKIRELTAAVTGDSLAGLTLAGLAFMVTWLAAVKRGARRTAFVLTMFVVIAASAYVLLPADYMGEYRFATPLFLFLPALLVTSLIRAGELLGSPLARRIAVTAALFVLLSLSGRQAILRTPAFAAAPTVPFGYVAVGRAQVQPGTPTCSGCETPPARTGSWGDALLFAPSSVRPGKAVRQSDRTDVGNRPAAFLRLRVRGGQADVRQHPHLLELARSIRP